MHDYLGTPTQAYDSAGNLVWEMLLDVYGRVMESRGDRSFVPFRYQGQYEDMETGLYYNRFRYYSPEMGMYISSDPIGLEGKNPTLYGYVQDVNIWLDPWGLIVVNPKDINFSQSTINRNFDTPDGKVNFETEVNRLKTQKKLNPEFTPEYPPIKVADYKGQLIVIDGNSRLSAVRKAKLKSIVVEKVSDIESLTDLSKRLRANKLGNMGTKKLPTCK